jgi:hypothetical protein
MMVRVLRDHEVIDEVTFSVIVPVHNAPEYLERRITAVSEPFSAPAVQVVAGHTRLETDTLWSKAFALRGASRCAEDPSR